MSQIKIEELTDEQRSQLPVYRDRWLAIGLSTQPCDREAAQIAVAKAYGVAGLPVPERIVWCESPLSLVLTDACLRHWASVRASVWASVRASVGDSVWASVRDSVWASVRASVGASVGDSVWASVRASVGASVGDSVRDSVWASVWASVGASVRDSVWASVWASVGASVGASVRDSVWDSVGASVYGSQDAAWLSFYNYFLEQCELEACEKLRPLMDLAVNCGWWIPRANIALLSEKPITCKVNERGVIHSDGSIAVEYRDGFGVYGWNGIRMPEKYGSVKSRDWESSWLLSETNAELKRALIEGIGYERLLKELEAKTLDSWREYELHRVDANVDMEPIQLLTMTCPSTGHKHCLRVPPGMDTARNAVTWCNHGIDPDSFITEH